MKIPRDKAIARLEERIDQRTKAHVAQKEKQDAKLFDALDSEIQRFTKHLNALKAARRARQPAQARLILSKKARETGLLTRTLIPDRIDRPDYTTEAMRQQLELLRMSDDDHVQVRNNSELHSYLVG